MSTITRSTAELERAQALLGHLGAVQAIIGAYPVAVPVSVDVAVYEGKATALLDNFDLPGLAGGLLSWAGALGEVTGEIWRLGDSTRLHLSVTGHTATGLRVRVFGGTGYDPAVFGELAAEEKRPVPLGQLHTWAQISGAGVAA